jgi:hypothetical protein
MLVDRGGALFVYDVASTKLNAYTAVNTTQDPAFGSDGSTFIVAENDPGAATTLRVRDLSMDLGAGTPPAIILATTVYGANTKQSAALAYVGRGTFDYGASKVVYGDVVGHGNRVVPVAAGSTNDATLGWPNGVGGRKAQCWVPAASAFFVFPGDGNLYRYTSASVADGLTQWWTGLTWKDTAGTTHETRLGPTAATTMVNRAQLQVTVPAPPAGTGTADDINAYGLYMTKVASGTPASTAFHLQLTAPPDPGGSSAQVVTSVNMAGAPPPTTNSFPTVGTAGYLASQQADASGPIISLKGDGSGRLGQATWDTTGVWSGIPRACSGQATTPVPGALNTVVSVAITFPAGLFTTAPTVTATVSATSPVAIGPCTVSGITTAGATLYCYRGSGGLAAISINWYATQ